MASESNLSTTPLPRRGRDSDSSPDWMRSPATKRPQQVYLSRRQKPHLQSAAPVVRNTPRSEPEASEEADNDPLDEPNDQALESNLPRPDTPTNEQPADPESPSTTGRKRKRTSKTAITRIGKNKVSSKKSKVASKGKAGEAGSEEDVKDNKDIDQTYPYRKVIASWAGRFVIDWVGNDPATGLPWKPSLEPKENYTGEIPELRVKGDAIVEAERTAALENNEEVGEDSEGEDEDDDGSYEIRGILDSITFPSRIKNRTLTLYLVDWAPGKSGKEVYDPEWVVNQNVSAEAIEQYKKGLEHKR